MRKKNKVLIFADWFSPGFKAGGPIRSITNFADRFAKHFEILVFTRDRDLNENAPYPGVKSNEWISTAKNYQVFYASPEYIKFNCIKAIIVEQQPDIIYLNSLYSFSFTILPLIVAKKFSKKVILAPRGMLKPSAINNKRFKKIIFLKAIKWSGTLKNVTFHATDQNEAEEINNHFPQNKGVYVIENLAAEVVPVHSGIKKVAGSLNILSVGRIHPIKNTHLIVDFVMALNGNVTLNVIGGFEDEEYSQKLKDAARGAVYINFLGALPHDQITAYIQESHLLLSPTKGENFGHAIFEAFLNAKPVIISDQTPWKNLAEKELGFDISLAEKDKFITALQFFVDMDNETYERYSKNVYNFISAYLNNNTTENKYVELFG